MGNFEELLKMMQSLDSFVVTVVPEKEGDPLNFRVFLERSSGVFKSNFVISNSFLAELSAMNVITGFALTKSATTRPVQVDMTYNCGDKLFLTAVNIRDPRFERAQKECLKHAQRTFYLNHGCSGVD